MSAVPSQADFAWKRETCILAHRKLLEAQTESHSRPPRIEGVMLPMAEAVAYASLLSETCPYEDVRNAWTYLLEWSAAERIQSFEDHGARIFRNRLKPALYACQGAIMVYAAMSQEGRMEA